MVNRFEVVVVGTGHGGVQTVTSLRQQGFSGSIALVGAEDELPYERPPLSKSYLRGASELDDFRLKPVQFWEDQNITLLLGSTVETVDVDSRQLTFSDGRSLAYEHLVWAAGGRARQLPLPGADLSSVYTIREFVDVDRLRRDLADSCSAVIIGGGYIGLEAAAVLRAQGLDVTVLEAQDRLLARVTCSVVSDYVAELHRRHGTDVRLSAGVDSVQGEGGRVTGVRLSDGSTLPADVVIVGVGLIPNVEPLASAGIVCTNGVDVDADFKTSADGVFAIGDCANYVSAYAGDVRVRLESVPNAAEHGRAVANVILGIANEQTSPPWFWSHQFDTKIQTVGLQQHHDEVVVRGDRTSDRFSVVYLQNGQIIALDCINKVGDFAQGKQLVARGVRAEAQEIDDPDVPLKSLLAKDAAAVPS